MLICNVSLHPPRSIAVVVAETATAADQLATTGSFSLLLVDETASAVELLDAYLGDIMVEAAAAAAVVDVGVIYALRIDEPANAVATADATISTTAIAGAIIEAATATDTQDGVIVGAPAVARSAMMMGMFVNSSGTPREAYVPVMMLNI